MNNFKNNRIVLSIFAILMVIGLSAAYIPMLFPQSAPEATPENYLDEAPATSTNDYVPATTTPSSSLPDSFSGLQDELKDILNK
jgi:hypothetical protein